MHLFLTSVLPFLAHNHASAAAFLTCRHHNFHASIIPEFLSDEERVQSFREARQQNQLQAELKTCITAYTNLYNLFVQSPLMQFSSSLVLHRTCAAESILQPLLGTKYFSRSLQRCVALTPLTTDLLQSLSQVQSLIKLDLAYLNNHDLEIIVDSFPSLETLVIQNAGYFQTVDPNTPINIASPSPPATKTLNNLALKCVGASFATQFVPHFTNLNELMLSGRAGAIAGELDLRPLLSSLPLLTNVSLSNFKLQNAESLKNLVHLSTLHLSECAMRDSLSFLTQQENNNTSTLPRLTTLWIHGGPELSTSWFASLSHAPNLHVLRLTSSENFNNDCLQYLENMVHLRKLELGFTKITSDSESFKTLMQNLFQLEELNLRFNRIGSRGAIAGALYSSHHSRLRVLNFQWCAIADNDLNGIGALKNTLEVLDLSSNVNLTSEGLRHCKDLVKLKVLRLQQCNGIRDLSP